MTCNFRYGFFSVDWISYFHRVNAAVWVETATLWQIGSRPSSRHRSRDALWAVEVTLWPPDNSSTASAISQCAAELPKRRMTKVDVRSQQRSLVAVLVMDFLMRLCFRRLVCATKFFGKVWLPGACGQEGFQRCHELLSGRVAQSPSKLHRAIGGFSLGHCFQQVGELFAVQRPFLLRLFLAARVVRL